MAYSVFGYKSSTVLTEQDMVEYVQSVVQQSSANIQAYVDQSTTENVTLKTYVDTQDTVGKSYTDSKISTLNTYVDIQDTVGKTYTDATVAAMKQTIDAEIASIVPVAPINTSSFLYSTIVPTSSQFPQFTGFGNAVSPSTLISHDSSKLALSVNASLIFRGIRSIGEVTAPVFRTYTIAIDTGSIIDNNQNDLTIKSKNVLFDNTGYIVLGQNGLYGGTEVRNFVPLLYFPTDIPIVTPRVVFSRNFSSRLMMPNTIPYFIHDFPTVMSRTYGSLQIPAISNVHSFGSIQWRFVMTGLLYSQGTTYHKLNLGCTISQNRISPGNVASQEYVMSLQHDDSPEDRQPTTTASKPCVFHLTCDIRVPPSSINTTRGTFFCNMLMNVSDNLPGSFRKEWTGSSSQNIYYDTPFSLNITMGWDAANVNKYIDLDSCTLTQCNF